jgi:branched-chain amino acid aminotransferase
MILWLDGKLIEHRDARIDPADRGFTLGDGLYETMAARGRRIIQLADHLQRLRQGCEVLRLPYPTLDIGAVLIDVLRANKLCDAALRLTLTRGVGARGIAPPENPQPTLLITTAPLPPLPKPARLVIATVTRRNEYSPLARIKSLNYLDNILARQEATSRDAGDAILLNTKGLAAEATSANIFIVKQGRILTPPVTDGVLPGVMRAFVLAQGEAREQSLSPEDIATADEVFLTNSLGIRQAVSLDGKPLNIGITADTLRAKWQET